MQQIRLFLENNLTGLHMPNIRITDIVESLIIAFLVYEIMAWARNTRLMSLLKGIIVIVVFIMLAAVFNMTTILWIVSHILSIAVIAVVVVLQPELRKALEELGRRRTLMKILPFDSVREEGRISDKTIKEITRACLEMARARTGALIVMERDHPLDEFERTGIEVDGIVTSQLLINIFEHNTPLHDGAVIVNGDRVTSATCYLPLSENMELSKDLGTRHRAGVGVSEVTDSMTIIVSEETGKISVAQGGELERNVESDRLEERLRDFQEKPEDESVRRLGRTSLTRKGLSWKNSV
ncbi:MAG: diadenylate cyclase CdaA [Lachnospiraceae bacterium]|nr:diadenylate cyclase CdaA [Lachnospiraceae bacterium]